MNAEQTKLTKRDVSAFLRECTFDPKEPQTRENVAARAGVDYCVNRAIEELVNCPRRENIQFAIKLLTIAGASDAKNRTSKKA